MVINKSATKRIIYFEIIFTAIYQWFVSELNVPSAIGYLLDLLNIVLLLYLLKFHKKIFSIFARIKAQSIYHILGILIVTLCIGAIINLVPPLFVFWAFRNNFRFFLFFLLCIYALEQEDVDKIFSNLYKLQFINVIISLYQYFVKGISWDNLGGIFGTSVGCNGYSNIFFCVLLIISISMFINKKANIKQLLFIVISTLALSVLSEIKFYFIEFVIIILLFVIFSRPNTKTFSILAISMAGIMVGLKFLARVFPDAVEVLTNYAYFQQYTSTAILGYNINRLDAFNQINQLFFDGDIIQNIMGRGFGNCDYSSVSFLCSPFYNLYGRYNYTFFSHEILFLETGYAGLILFIFFFISIVVWATRNKHLFHNRQEYRLLAQVLPLIIIINLWYNNSIRVEIAYITFFALASPFVIAKNNPLFENW